MNSQWNNCNWISNYILSAQFLFPIEIYKENADTERRTGQIFDDSGLVNWGGAADPEVVGHSPQISMHSTDGKEDAGPVRPRYRLLPLLTSATRHFGTKKSTIRPATNTSNNYNRAATYSSSKFSNTN